jgi:hypothetical protein
MCHVQSSPCFLFHCMTLKECVWCGGNLHMTSPCTQSHTTAQLHHHTTTRSHMHVAAHHSYGQFVSTWCAARDNPFDQRPRSSSSEGEHRVETIKRVVESSSTQSSHVIDAGDQRESSPGDDVHVSCTNECHDGPIQRAVGRACCQASVLRPPVTSE